MLELVLDDCRTLLKKFHRSTIQHIFREANQCADVMAKLGAIISSNYINFVNPLPVVEDVLVFDKAEFFIYLFFFFFL